ncbi:uncharacterized protein TrAtP1_005744 [Trichoderma atroviride]|uniref:uncharacterized protein n=1 Tax=Hypocrea atroviridis TaxID=63577 RepID=UPI0033244EF6|nr:hypothetical protein TrAtP1_005744 [Trichoderma atroviride]
MQLASVNLPKIHLSDNGQYLDLSLEGSLKLQFPDGVKVPQTSTDLLKLVAEERLWIARIGSCHFHVIVSIQGECVTAGDQIAELTEWIQYCEVWAKAGIRLQSCERGIDEPLSKMSFSIQHPDLSSALVTPKGASTAEFQSVVCYVDVSPAKPSLKRKRNKATEDAGDTLLNAQRILEYFSQQTYRETRKPSRSAKPPKTESMKQLRQFLDIALELMVLGSRKQYKGITTNTCSWAECLTQLAPAVFSMQYLKIIYDRASLLSTIATSLARMKNAESPSLRYKTATFAGRVVDENCDRGDCVIRGIEKGAWDVLLSSVRIPTRSRQARREVDVASSITETQSEAISCEPGTLLSEIQVERKDYGNKPQIGEHSLVESYDMRDALFQPFQQGNLTFFGSRLCNTGEVKAANPNLLPSHGGYLETGANCILDDPAMTPMRELEYPITPDSSSPYYAINHGIPLLDVQPLTTFNDWLCSGGFTTEYTDAGASCETILPSGYDEDVCFYKSYE